MILDPITEVTASTIAIPLDKPLHLGAMTISTRRYTHVIVTTRSGLCGHAFALSRDMPIPQVVRSLQPILVGRDADAIATRYEEATRVGIAGGRAGVFARGVALVDTALWDIKAQRAGLPLWRLLGGGDSRAPVLLVAGYPRDDEEPETLAGRVVARGRDGYTTLKVARALDRNRMHRLLSAISDQLDDTSRVVVDCGWHFRTPREVVDEVRQWPEAPIAWVEDPLPSDDVRANAQLRKMLPLPVGIGDDLTDRITARELLLQEAVDVLRVDVGALGVTGALQMCSMARTLGVPVSLHIYPETSIQLAAAFSPPIMVETFDPVDNPFDPTHRFLRGGPTFEAGWATAPDSPGLGFTIDTNDVTIEGA